MSEISPKFLNNLKKPAASTTAPAKKEPTVKAHETETHPLATPGQPTDQPEQKDIHDADGNKAHTITMKNGKLDDPYTAYYDNGKVKQILHYKEGILNGPMQVFSPTGELEHEMMFVDGTLNGLAVLYTHGRVGSKSHYKNGLQDGVAFYYDTGGRVTSKVMYSKNKFKGPFISYNKEGKIVKESLYKDGMLNGLSTSYYPSGKVFQKQTYKNGVPDGKQEKYFESGKPLEVDTFENGALIEKETYNLDGSIKSKQKFKETTGTSTPSQKPNTPTKL